MRELNQYGKNAQLKNFIIQKKLIHSENPLKKMCVKRMRGVSYHKKIGTPEIGYYNLNPKKNYPQPEAIMLNYYASNSTLLDHE